jgi:hypothetical protein
MKPILFCCLLAIQCCLSAQDSVKLKRLYVELGACPVTFNKLGSPDINVSLVADVRKELLFGVRLYGSSWVDPNDPTPNSFFLWDQAIHTITELNFSVGKVFPLKSWFNIALSTGPSYVHYIQPENFSLYYQPGIFGGVYPSYRFDYVNHNLFGWGTRLDANLFLRHAAGLSVGVFWNYNSVYPLGGVNINLILGKINPRKWRSPHQIWVHWHTVK